jgi:hypothetical protein
MQYERPFLAVILALLTVLFACESNEIGESRDVNQDKIYMDYDISYAEGDENVMLNLQYRFAGSAGTTLVLNDPSQVSLDGEKLKADSSDGIGAFYETTKNFTCFSGKHNISFTDMNGKRFENSFEFFPVSLAERPVTAVRTKDLVIHFNAGAHGPNDHIAISSLATDSSFYYQQSGSPTSITIPAAELIRQKKPEIQFETMVYREIPLSQTTSEGGLLKLNYQLKPVKIVLQR